VIARSAVIHVSRQDVGDPAGAGVEHEVVRDALVAGAADSRRCSSRCGVAQRDAEAAARRTWSP
jgi:hypothetical protein